MDLHYNPHLTEFFFSDKHLKNAICHGKFTDTNNDTYGLWHSDMVWFMTLNGHVFLASTSPNAINHEYIRIENSYLKEIDL